MSEDINSFLRVNHDERPMRRGDLLVAEPLLRGPYFDRAVILILDADDENGVMGLVVNKSTTLTLADIVPDWPGAIHIPVYCGGPVETTRLFMLHSLGDRFPGSLEIAPGLYVGGNLEDIVNYVNEGGQTEGRIRFFVGYSGWGSSQLANELKENVWAPANPISGHEILRGSDNAFWRREVERLGPRYRSWLTVPDNPSFN